MCMLAHKAEISKNTLFIFCLYDVISGVKFQNEVVLETVSERGVSEEGLQRFSGYCEKVHVIFSCVLHYLDRYSILYNATHFGLSGLTGQIFRS